MSKAILISIKPEWVAKILNGEKTIEIRKTKPKQYLNDYNFEAYDVYIYCTKGKPDIEPVLSLKGVGVIAEPIKPNYLNGKVVAKFSLNKIEQVYWVNERPKTKTLFAYDILKNSRLSQEDFENYVGDSQSYAWHIEELEIFDKPKELSDFLIKSHKVQGIDKNGGNKTFTILKPLTKAPQSWCYVKGE